MIIITTIVIVTAQHVHTIAKNMMDKNYHSSQMSIISMTPCNESQIMCHVIAGVEHLPMHDLF